ncbi:LysR family transcriptional regulator [Herbiconiux ginsengi]|uniref:DNA-binding transcriptional regulator, LysR family n=1 Tax=Herbiconiux ginsengi TaxID=381665 RepID=A0A1H3TN18_9MICO|nr:LysR family transcriptional regulator [Herbiconiux ginsengi]SDZ51035.1 DNA-binding transcriptional regulator, LysR family [Herbiconiux ginsengi]
MADLDLRKLRYFAVVAEELNFGRAAERLRIAQPVLSRQIAALEKELGVELFVRSQRGTRLTAAGAALRDDARDILTEAAALQRRVRRGSRAGRSLGLGFMPGLIVTRVVRALTERFPALAVEVVRTSWDDQVEMVHDGRVDASFVRLPIARDGLRVTVLFAEPRVVALPASHELAGASRAGSGPVGAGASGGVQLADLLPLRLLQAPDAVPEWRDALRAAGTDPQKAARGRPVVHTVEEKLEQVAALRGVVVLPESTARFYTRPDVVYRMVDDLPPNEVAVVSEARNEVPEIEALHELAVRLMRP